MGHVSRIHPWSLTEKPDGSKDSGKESRFSTGFTGSIHSHLDGLVVRGDQGWQAVDGDGNGEALASSRSSNKSEVAKFGHLVLHNGRVVS
jgi:hypothetical protein